MSKSKGTKRKLVIESDSEDEEKPSSKRTRRNALSDHESKDVEMKTAEVPDIVIDIGSVVDKDMEFRKARKGVRSGFLYRFQSIKSGGPVWIGFGIWTNDTLFDHLEQIAYRITDRYKQDVAKGEDQTWHEVLRNGSWLTPVRDGGIWHDLPDDLAKRTKMLKKRANDLAGTLNGKLMDIHNFDNDKTSRNISKGTVECKTIKPKRGSRSLKSYCPEIFAQIHPTKNRGINTYKLTFGCKVKLWWKCSVAKCNHHIWPATVNQRTSGYGCSWCSGKYTCRCDSFGYLFPELLEDFVGGGNERKKAFEISPGSNTAFNWKCSVAKCQHHNWSAMVSDRTKGRGCAYCAGQKTCNCDSFGYLRPDILTEFVSGGNILEKAFAISPGSGQVFKWKCSKLTCKCVWPASVNNRVRGYGCPKCNESHMEKRCSEILDKRKLKFIPQKSFLGLKHKRSLKFDRYLKLAKAVIELDGKQHFAIIKTWESKRSNLEDRRTKDKIKNDFCRKNGIHLLRIAPSQAKNMEQHIDEYLRRIGDAKDGERIEMFMGDEYHSS